MNPQPPLDPTTDREAMHKLAEKFAGDREEHPRTLLARAYLELEQELDKMKCPYPAYCPLEQ